MLLKFLTSVSYKTEENWAYGAGFDRALSIALTERARASSVSGDGTRMPIIVG